MESPVSQFNDQSRSLVALDQDSTLIAVIEMGQSSWLVGGLVPGLVREPQKKLSPDAAALLKLLDRWRAEAAKAGRGIARVCVAYEAGRAGFWR
jgi:transposase